MDAYSFPEVLGPLAALQADPTVRDIMVDAPDRVYVMRDDANYEWEDTDVAFDSIEALRGVIDAVFAASGQWLGPDRSVGEIRLPDGSHMIAVLPPTAVEGPYLAIRKGHRAPSITWENTVAWGAISEEARDFLLDRLRDDVGRSILVTGNAFSGKSAFARLMAKSIPDHRRVIVVASASDMQVEHPRRIYLEPGGPGLMSTGDLLDVAAKLKPDWLVLPEMNGTEAFRAVQLMSGPFKAITEVTTLSPEEALSQVEALCLTANPGAGLGEIRTLVASAIGFVVHLQSHALPDYRRKVTRIVEVRGIEHDRYVLQPLFAYDEEQGTLLPTAAREAWEAEAGQRITGG
jgi:pilus assembly protein CpaF